MSKALEMVNASNNWTTDLSRKRVFRYGRQYPWTVAFVILFLAMLAGLTRSEQIDNRRLADRQQVTAQDLVRDRQFCRAIPNTAEASADALVNILVLDAIARGLPQERIDRLKRLGALYAAEARRLAIDDLPECARILDNRP